MAVTFDEFVWSITLKYHKICLTTFCTDPRYGLKDHQLFRRWLCVWLMKCWNAIGVLLVFPAHFIDFEAPRDTMCDIAIKPLRSMIKNKIGFFVLFLFHSSTALLTKGCDSNECKQCKKLKYNRTKSNRTLDAQSFDRSSESPDVRRWQ